MSILNQDGKSVKGCSMIYAPAGQAGEYSALAANPYRGCGHKCAYCYVPSVLRMDRREFDAAAIPRPMYITALKKDCAKYKEHGITDQVMFSFTTDPYHPFDNRLTREAIKTIQRDTDLGICTLTKGGSRSLRDIDLFRPKKDAFASTLTSLDDAFSKKWEGGAALPGDRLHALKTFHNAGIFTWVSLEPTLDIESSLQIVLETYEYVDLYKVGRVNYLPMTKTTDWKDYTFRMIDLLNKKGKAHYIKKDLQCYLPENYPNPLRVPQHH
jgi:DNA repair photolyase